MGESVEQKVLEMVAQVARVDASTLSRESRFGCDIATKSIHILQLTALLSNAFGIQISMSEARKNSTIGDVVDMIEAKTSQA